MSFHFGSLKSVYNIFNVDQPVFSTHMTNVTAPIGAVGSSNPSGAIKSDPKVKVNMAVPLSYEFRVAEHVDGKGNIVKVGLQLKVTEHDPCTGYAVCLYDWQDVERVRIPV
jgi:hypothetical protein